MADSINHERQRRSTMRKKHGNLRLGCFGQVTRGATRAAAPAWSGTGLGPAQGPNTRICTREGCRTRATPIVSRVVGQDVAFLPSPKLCRSRANTECANVGGVAPDLVRDQRTRHVLGRVPTPTSMHGLGVVQPMIAEHGAKSRATQPPFVWHVGAQAVPGCAATYFASGPRSNTLSANGLQ